MKNGSLGIVESVTAERQATPDYGPTLHPIDDRMTQFAGWARRVAETPLLRMTPAKLEQEIARVAVSARKADHKTIERGHASMTAAIEGIDRVTDSAWKASDQTRALLITAGVSALLAVILTLALVGLYSGDVPVPISQAAPAHVAAAPATPQQAAPSAHHRRHRVALD